MGHFGGRAGQGAAEAALSFLACVATTRNTRHAPGETLAGTTSRRITEAYLMSWRLLLWRRAFAPSPSRQHFTMRPFPSVGCISLLALTGTALAASGSLEVDLVFPQNDTYAPEPIIPVAFAFQNSELASYLQPSVSFSIIPYGNYTKSIASGSYDLTWENLTSSDPYMLYGEALEVLNTEGTWLLEWELSVTNCSGSGDNLDFRQDTTRRRLTFSTKSGAKRPDLTAATSDDSCDNAQSSAFQITDTRDAGDHFDNRKACAVLAMTTPSAEVIFMQSLVIYIR